MLVTKFNEELAEMKDATKTDKPKPDLTKKKDKKQKKADKKNKNTAAAVEVVEEEKHNPFDDISEVKIADISFAYDNRTVIQLLQARGAAIARKDYNKMRAIDAKI